MATLTIDTKCFEALRHGQGLDTVQALAAALGIDKGTASRVLNGKAAPGPRFISSVLRTFPVKFEDVFVVVDNDEPANPVVVGRVNSSATLAPSAPLAVAS